MVEHANDNSISRVDGYIVLGLLGLSVLVVLFENKPKQKQYESVEVNDEENSTDIFN